MRVILAFLITAAALCAAEKAVEAYGLNAKSFADDGRLFRKFTAQSANGPFTAPVVRLGKIEFFGKGSGSRPSAVLEWPEARYVRSEEVIVGDGIVQFRTDEESVSGRGFRCELEIGRLELKSEVKFSSEEFRMSGGAATVDFDAKQSKRDEVLRTIEMTGDIVVEREATAKAPFERAESSFARFIARENKVYLKSPLAVWRSGERSTIEVASGFVEIDLGEKKPNKAPEPTTTSVTSPAAQEPRQP